MTVAKKDIKAFSEDGSRRRREESAVQLRKTKKEESLNKKRNITLSSVEEAGSAASAPGAASVPGVPDELNIKHLQAYVSGELLLAFGGQALYISISISALSIFSYRFNLLL
jgi:Importin beta binding domain